jgi:hypothetical protein
MKQKRGRGVNNRVSSFYKNKIYLKIKYKNGGQGGRVPLAGVQRAAPFGGVWGKAQQIKPKTKQRMIARER